MMHDPFPDTLHQQYIEESSPHNTNMGHCGVTRPLRDEDDGDKTMSMYDCIDVLHRHHQQTLWVYWTVILVARIILSLLSFVYGVTIVALIGGRSVQLIDTS
ncbi:MAG TPA: hypothetical protein VL095_08345 [Flavisolibacter sp.]|nr:hypothetical protein [Flavisolibacter sp.]